MTLVTPLHPPPQGELAKPVYHVDQNSSVEIQHMFIRYPMVLDVFYNILAEGHESLMVHDPDLDHKEESYDLEYIYLPFLLRHGIIREAKEDHDTKRYETDYSDILIDPKIGRRSISHMVIQRANSFENSLYYAKQEDSIAALIIGYDDEYLTQEMIREFKELSHKWQKKLGTQRPSGSLNSKRITLTVLGESSCF